MVQDFDLERFVFDQNIVSSRADDDFFFDDGLGFKFDGNACGLAGGDICADALGSEPVPLKVELSLAGRQLQSCLPAIIGSAPLDRQPAPPLAAQVLRTRSAR